MTYSEGARDGIEPNMHFVDKVCRIAHAAERTSRIDIVLPTIQFFVPLQRQIVPLIPCFKQQAVGLQVCALDICQVAELNDTLRRCQLAKGFFSLSRNAYENEARLGIEGRNA
jgi:hypothetical protein